MDLKAVYLGNKVDKDQVLGFIFDELCGVEVKFLVNQQQIQLLQKSMPIVIQSDALPEDLSGTIISVGSYDVVSEDIDKPLLFPVVAKIINLPNSMNILGLGVNVIINTDALKQIRLPIKAINIEHDQAYVTKINTNDTRVKTKVILGKSGLDDVEVVAGVVVGDKVLLHD